MIGLSLNPVSRAAFGRAVSATARLRSTLFGSGQQGVFYVLKPVVDGQQVLYQDSAGTTQVTADGQPVGYIKDLSGNGNHATQSTAAAKPTYPDLVTDGVDDVIQSNYSYGDISQGFTISCVAKLLNLSADDDYFFALGNSSLNGTLFAITYRSIEGIAGIVRNDGLSTAKTFSGVALDSLYHVITIITKNGNDQRLYVDGVLIDSGVGSISPITVDRLALGALVRSGPAVYANANTKAAIAVKAALSDADRHEMESYLADLAGVTL